MISRRKFVQLSAGLGLYASLGRWNLTQAVVQDYKALVCLFLFGGNDGHNMVVPMNSTQYAAYLNARGSLALTGSQLLPINDPALGPFALHYAMPEMQVLFSQGKLAVLANVGVLTQSTSYASLSNPSFALPTNLRSHSDQVVQMQSGYTNANGSSGWGGRTLDGLQSHNSASTFPVSIAMNSPALFCTGAAVQGNSLQPGNYLDQNGLSAYPTSAAQARATAQQQIILADSGNDLINAANQSLATATALNPILKSAAGSVTFPKAFPSVPLGDQLKEIARLISLNQTLGVGRQVFFCSLGGFDTHSGQPYQQWDLLQQVSQALDAFYAALSSWSIDQQVTTFTLSDFGRTLQPDTSGTDHGWGNHHLILGGAVRGGQIYGRFPLMTNYANFNATADDYADNRGVMLPSTSLAQYGATLVRWFGATDAQLGSIFPQLTSFSVNDLGFLG